MFLENILRVSNACKGVLDYVWIESRIVNTANRVFFLGVVTAMAGAVHHHGLSGDWVTMADSSSFMVITAPTSVHHHWHCGAPP